MAPSSVSVLAFVSVVALSFGTGCERKKKVPVDEPAAETAVVKSVLEKYPADQAEPGSKLYPLRPISTENLLGRIKESGPPASWQFSIVDARQRVEYDADHIAGAINVPAEKIDALLPTMIADKERQIVFYCNGATCTKSQKAARAALALGYSKSYVYEGGMPVWREGRHPIEGDPLPQVEVVKLAPQAVHELLKSKAVTLVDIRPRDEYLHFRVTGAVYIELDDIRDRLKDFVKPGPSPVVIADYTGTQGELAVRYLTKLGYTNVKTMEGGLRAWSSAKLPVEKGVTADVNDATKVAGKAPEKAEPGKPGAKSASK